MNRLSKDPSKQPRAEVSTKAPADPRNTANFDWLSAAKQKVASWVLSPNSAKNMEPKVAKKTLKSTSGPPCDPPLEERLFQLLALLLLRQQID